MWIKWILIGVFVGSIINDIYYIDRARPIYTRGAVTIAVLIHGLLIVGILAYVR